MATKRSTSVAKGVWQFSVASCLAFLAAEAAYLIFVWNLNRTTVDPGLLGILAVECWFMLQITTADVKQKHAEGATSKGGMLYTRMTALGLLALMVATLPSLHLPYTKYIGVAACLVTCFGRIMWLRQDTARSYLSSSNEDDPGPC